MRNRPDYANSLAGGGQMGARIRAFDWSKTPLGPIEEWPSSLVEAVSICLPSRFQLAIYWGPHSSCSTTTPSGTSWCNAPACPRNAGGRILTEMWDVVGPMLRGVLEGEERPGRWTRRCV